MDALLPVIREALSGLPQLNRRSDCYVTPHENYMPTGTRLPCLGIKDAGGVPEEIGGGMIELTAKVSLVGFVKLTVDGELAVVEVFNLVRAAKDLLKDNALGMADFRRVQIGAFRPTELFQADNNQWMVKLVSSLIYTLERPE